MTPFSRRRLAPAALLALALAVAGCSGGTPSSAQDPSPSAPAATASAGSSAATPGSGASSSAGTAAQDPAHDPAKDPALAAFYGQKLTWRSCESSSGAPGFQCSSLTVPIDYAKPRGGTIKLALIRLPASDQSKRIGSLLLNPGGPGGSGIEYAGYAPAVVSDPVRARYDVVGFDPRGVGESAPVRCMTDQQTDAFLAADASPDTSAETAQLVDMSKQLGAECAKRNPALIAHVGTKDVARDMDVLRAALGDDKLHYLGKSYGTFIGATYADLFPWRVGRMVLDGALDPRSTSEEVNLGQAGGFELAFDSFLTDCLSKKTCPFHGSKDEARSQLADFLARVDAHPLPTDSGRQLTQALAVLGMVYAMYDEGFWPQLRSALTAGLKGDGSQLLLLADAYAERDPDGHYRSNSNDVIYAVNCLDRPEPDGPSQVEAALPQYEKASPLFGDYIAWSSLPCHYWPVPAQDQPHAVHAPGAPPIVVVGTTRDPATPYAWAQGLADQLDKGVLLTYVGDGHTAYRRGSQCIDSAVDAYLLQGKPPADGTRCS